ncbi:IS701 family transposase [Nocardia sp. CA-084685]|uniref:IS701 family transposase n=1 Tax=Nocardia sp. CA-084685 TaxID=3239970 RepID=UPI003D951FFD
MIEHFGATDATLVVDGTGDHKKGVHTVGVQRQYTGTAGRVENSQVAVYLTYATAPGHAFLDRALYLPKSWTADPARCQQAGVPDDVRFATKPALAKRMITDALDAGVPAPWVTGDEVYGSDPKLRAALESRSTGYVFAVACDHRVATSTGRVRADALAATPPKVAWQPLTVGYGAKRPPRLRLGLDRDRSRRRQSRARMPLADDPPQPAHRRAGLLPLLEHQAGAAGPADEGRRPPLVDGGEFPNRQNADRARSASGPKLAVLAPLDPAGPCSPMPSSPSWPSRIPPMSHPPA